MVNKFKVERKKGACMLFEHLGKQVLFFRMTFCLSRGSDDLFW
jgi:hypothetical protein